MGHANFGNTNYKIPLIVIVGTTGSGKSVIAMKIAKKYNGEIISADSRTIYRGMNIGTAKPSKTDQAEIPHHLIDVVDPDERFTAADFKKLANIAIRDIINRGNLPILVGGTGLYIDSIIFDFKFAGDVNRKNREKLNKKSIKELIEIIHNRGEYAIDSHNRRHMIRYLETGGTPIQPKKLRINTFLFGIERTKTELRKRLVKRTENMFRKGLRKEVKELSEKYGWDNEAMTGIIYKLFRENEENNLSMTKIKRKFVLRDIQLAKRQKSWFKRNTYVKWFDEERTLMESIERLIVELKSTI